MARPRILLADDHKEMRERVLRVLERDYDLLEAVTDGKAMLDAASSLNPDLCVLDISMPIINGIEVATQLRKSGSRSKIVFLTIHEDPDFVRAAFDAGASGYVIKRRLARDLLRAVREALAGRTFTSAMTR